MAGIFHSHRDVEERSNMLLLDAHNRVISSADENWIPVGAVVPVNRDARPQLLMHGGRHGDLLKLKTVLEQISETGSRSDELFSQSIRDLYETVLASRLRLFVQACWNKCKHEGVSARAGMVKKFY